MSTENIVMGLNSTIKMLTDIKEKVIKDNNDNINVICTQKRDIKPQYKIGFMNPIGFRVEGPTITSISIMDNSEIGKILT